MTPLEWIPLRWPAAWREPSALGLLAGSPVNCLVNAAGAVRQAALARGLAVIDWEEIAAAPLAKLPWDTPRPVLAVTDAVWPRMKPAPEPDSAEAGPTGAPWVDSNGWLVELVRMRAPGKACWLVSDPPADDAQLRFDGYRMAIAEAAASGARWLITLQTGLAAALAVGDAKALAGWHSMLATAAFFEQRRQWRSYASRAALGVVSSFAGGDYSMATEVLNLASRRGLLYRVIDRSRAEAASFDGLRAILYVDREPPAAGLGKKLADFAAAGGVLIAQKGDRRIFPGLENASVPFLGYEVGAVGKGRIAIAVREWDDPFRVAADAHILMSRRNDPVRVFNGGTIGCRYSAAPGGGTAVVELLNYARRSAISPITVAVAEKYGSASIWTLERQQPVAARIVRRSRSMDEVALPPFAVYAAVELRR